MGKNKVTKPNKRNNPIYKKVTSKSNIKGKNKSKPVKTSIAKVKITNQKVREELDCKWKKVQANAAKGASTSGKTPASTSNKAKTDSTTFVGSK